MEEFPTADDIVQLPLAKQQLRDLFDYLDRPDPEPCSHTFQETIAFLDSRRIEKQPVLDWLRANGGFCDCEVIFNVDAEWGEYVGRTYEDDDADGPSHEQSPQPAPAARRRASAGLVWAAFLIPAVLASGYRVYAYVQSAGSGALSFDMIIQPFWLVAFAAIAAWFWINRA